MNKEFIPYEQALELKELGFDESCLAFYDGKGGEQIYFNSYRNGSGDYEPFKKMERITWFGAPLYQQAFRWFREYYGLNGYVGGKSTKHYWQIESFIEEDGALNQSPYWHYTDAQLDCLKKLIEIAKNK